MLCLSSSVSLFICVFVFLLALCVPVQAECQAFVGVRSELQSTHPTEEVLPRKVCVCVLWLDVCMCDVQWRLSRANIPSLFCNIAQPDGYRMCFFSQDKPFTCTVFLTPSPLFSLSSDLIYTGKCQKISPSQHTQELSVSNPSHSADQKHKASFLFVFTCWLIKFINVQNEV